MKTASCLCGGVKFELRGPLEAATACHCTQCRKQTGNYWTSTNTADGDIHFLSKDSLKWYRSSTDAQRGFCGDCGSTLFWKGDGSARTAVCTGSIDGPSGVALGGHIFCENAGDYYEIAGGEYRRPQA